MRPARIEAPPKGCAPEGVGFIVKVMLAAGLLCIALNIGMEIWG